MKVLKKINKIYTWLDWIFHIPTYIQKKKEKIQNIYHLQSTNIYAPDEMEVLNIISFSKRNLNKYQTILADGWRLFKIFSTSQTIVYYPHTLALLLLLLLHSFNLFFSYFFNVHRINNLCVFLDKVHKYTTIPNYMETYSYYKKKSTQA